MGIFGETLSTFKSCLDAHVANHMQSSSLKCEQTVVISLSKLLEAHNIIMTG